MGRRIHMRMLFLSIFMFFNLHSADKPVSRITTLTQLVSTHIEKLFKEEDSQFLKSVTDKALYYDNNLFAAETLRQALIKKGPVLDAILERIGTPKTFLVGVYSACTTDMQSPAGYVVSRKNMIEWGCEGNIHRSIPIEGISTITALATESDGSVYFAGEHGAIMRLITQDSKLDQIYPRLTKIKSIKIIDNTMLIQCINIYSEYKILIKKNGAWYHEKSIFTSIAQLIKKNRPVTALSDIVNIFSKTSPATNHERYYNITAFPLSGAGKRILLKNCEGDPILCPEGTNALYPTKTGINECAVNRGFAGKCAEVYTDHDQNNPGTYSVLSCHPTLPLGVITCTKKDVTEVSMLNLKTGKNFPLYKTLPCTHANALFTADGENILLATQFNQNELDKTVHYIKVPIVEELQKISLKSILRFLTPERPQ